MLAVRNKRIAKPVAFVIAVMMILLYSIAVVPVYAADGAEFHLHLNKSSIDTSKVASVSAEIEIRDEGGELIGTDIADFVKHNNNLYNGVVPNTAGYSSNSKALVTRVIVEMNDGSILLFEDEDLDQDANGIGMDSQGNLWILGAGVLQNDDGDEGPEDPDPEDPTVEKGWLTVTKEVIGEEVEGEWPVFSFTIVGEEGSGFETIEFTLSDGQTELFELPYGIYTVVEEEFEGYTADDAEQKVEIDCPGDMEVPSESLLFVNRMNDPGEEPGDEPGEDVDEASIDKTVDRSSVRVGDNVTFTIVVTNENEVEDEPTPVSTGPVLFIYQPPGVIYDISVLDILPAGLEYVSHEVVDGDDSDYSTEDGIWAVGTLGPGESAVLKIVAKAVETGTHKNTATLRFGDESKDSSASVTVTRPGGGGGGTTTPKEPPVEIPDDPTPEAPAEEPEGPADVIPDEVIPEAPAVPKTGINDHLALLSLLMMGSAAGVGLVIRKRRVIE